MTTAQVDVEALELRVAALEKAARRRLFAARVSAGLGLVELLLKTYAEYLKRKEAAAPSGE